MASISPATIPNGKCFYEPESQKEIFEIPRETKQEQERIVKQVLETATKIIKEIKMQSRMRNLTINQY
jgi:hypothetical protein